MSNIIVGIGTYLPERIVTNDDLAAMELDYDRAKTGMILDEWARSRHGAISRHWAAPGECTSDMATVAARRALGPGRVGRAVRPGRRPGRSAGRAAAGHRPAAAGRVPGCRPPPVAARLHPPVHRRRVGVRQRERPPPRPGGRHRPVSRQAVRPVAAGRNLRLLPRRVGGRPGLTAADGQVARPESSKGVASGR